MKLYQVTYNNGEDYGDNVQIVLAVFDSMEKATAYIHSKGFTAVTGEARKWFQQIEEFKDKDWFERKREIGLPPYYIDYLVIDVFDVNKPKRNFI